MIVTRGMGTGDNLLVTRGYGETLYIVVKPHASFYGMGSGKDYYSKRKKRLKQAQDEDLLKDLIRTETIYLRASDSTLRVKAISAKLEEVDSIKILAKSLGFTEVVVLMENEVEIIEDE